MTIVQCAICGKAAFKYPSQLRPQNCCSAECRNELNRRRNLEINVPGHNAGHPAPWLTQFNRLLSIHENTVNVEPEEYRSVVEKAIGRKL